MARIKATVAYDGTHFSGWQVQPLEKAPTGRTIQQVVEEALTRFHKGREVKVSAAGRTDAGVHAYGQVIHFDTDISMPAEKWPEALLGHLPPDVQFVQAEYAADDFNAREQATGKEYRYRVLRRRQRDVFRRNYTYHLYGPLDIVAMREAAATLTGTHDYTSFCGTNTAIINKVRTIQEIELAESEDELEFIYRGTGFLYHMVRIMTGTILDIGSGKIQAGTAGDILAAKDRRRAGKTVPGHGLYLHRVDY
ncbi:tRNA pseudouridine38-40 synthase [Salsuginibacillus halophilus]|uniref:tRNA pseudouridine synthase A n=1 Tax=Salsuginibacillus halophilus TaxID=517424 RepID=A0A2P8H8J7_9BACI|nr:tRNA pseudouridine(38-40) synthase TruA [Salsuginibacillus halophilus]PSL42556.1 tRNA pseudouridine38-40 synthase [Salsuginibacillus halophilus]